MREMYNQIIQWFTKSIYYVIFISITLLPCPNNVYSQVNDLVNNTIELELLSVFKDSHQSSDGKSANLSFVLSKDIDRSKTKMNFEIDPSTIENLVSSNPQTFLVDLFLKNDQVIHLEFHRSDIISSDYILKTNKGKVKPSEIFTFQSIDEDYLTTCTIINDKFFLSILGPNGGVFRLSAGQKVGEYFMLKEQNTFDCQTDDDKHMIGNSDISTPVTREKSSTAIYIEVDYDKYLDHDSDLAEVEAHVISLFNDVSSIFAMSYVDIEISEIMVWTSTDPYSSLYSVTNVLDKFGQELYDGFNGQLAHLISGRNLGGGLAWIDVLCTDPEIYWEDWDNDGQDEEHYKGPFSISANHTTSLTTFPNYSYNVQVVTHELGHNFGSPHTHACVWGPNNNQALDNCWSTEGDCNSGAAPTSGGTIMSFCHTSSYGINFLNGFGEEPGTLIYNKFANASCVEGEEIPGELCLNPIPILATTEFICDGPATGHGSFNSDATHSRWYIIEPDSETTATISSCVSSVNTRLWIYEGTCNELVEIGNNDDNCNGTSSYLQDIVLETGKTYFLEWDNKWSDDGFNFQIELVENNICIPVENLPNPIIDGSYSVSGDATLDSMTTINDSLLLCSDQSVTLGPGFEMDGSFDFEILIQVCSEIE